MEIQIATEFDVSTIPIYEIAGPASDSRVLSLVRGVLTSFPVRHADPTACFHGLHSPPRRRGCTRLYAMSRFPMKRQEKSGGKIYIYIYKRGKGREGRVGRNGHRDGWMVTDMKEKFHLGILKILIRLVQRRLQIANNGPSAYFADLIYDISRYFRVDIVISPSL